jgi:hypothetical protein
MRVWRSAGYPNKVVEYLVAIDLITTILRLLGERWKWQYMV